MHRVCLFAEAQRAKRAKVREEGMSREMQWVRRQGSKEGSEVVGQACVSRVHDGRARNGCQRPLGVGQRVTATPQDEQRRLSWDAVQLTDCPDLYLMRSWCPEDVEARP